jgi:hypothetical protein
VAPGLAKGRHHGGTPGELIVRVGSQGRQEQEAIGQIGDPNLNSDHFSTATPVLGSTPVGRGDIGAIETLLRKGLLDVLVGRGSAVDVTV